MFEVALALVPVLAAGMIQLARSIRKNRRRIHELELYLLELRRVRRKHAQLTQEHAELRRSLDMPPHRRALPASIETTQRVVVRQKRAKCGSHPYGPVDLAIKQKQRALQDAE